MGGGGRPVKTPNGKKEKIINVIIIKLAMKVVFFLKSFIHIRDAKKKRLE